MKKLLSLILIFFLVSSSFQAVFAKDICEQAKNATCDNIAEIDVNVVRKNCSESTLQDFYDAISKCKRDIKSQLENVIQERRSAEWYLSKLNLDIRYLNYEIANLNLSISQLESEIEKREKAIEELENALSQQREILSEAVRQVYEYDTTSYVEVLLANGSLSELGSKLMEMDSIQTELRLAMSEIQKAKEKMEKEKKAMERDLEEKEEYRKIQEYSMYSLAIKQEQQEYFLRQLARDENVLKRQLGDLQSALIYIQSYLSKWVLGEQPTPLQILSAIQRASAAYPGLRPALLLGVLYAESKYNNNLGVPGRYKEYCDGGWGGCSHLDELRKICDKYGYNINQVPMSTGCAIGPFQFVPCTWRGYGKGGNPWNLNDASIAAAFYLNTLGASTNETKALIRYNCGYRDWCSNDPGVQRYVETVLNKAAEWDPVIEICGFKLNCPQMEKKIEEEF